jgi:NAD(P)-dependent dehydrogenase (short-subunit alcohol dehydrogenase family)
MAEDKFALVTGAGRGIGKSAALALAKAGWHVALAGRSVEPLAATAREIEALGRRALALFAAIARDFGRLDLLFNNAGATYPEIPMDELTYEQWKAVVDVNLTGVFLCAQGAMAMMKRQDPRGGRIINNGSISAHAPRPMSAPYTATKHGVAGLTKSIALDGRAFDIACGQIDIGNAQTDMTARMAKGVLQADGRVAVEPRIDSAEIGEAIVHMASLPLSSNILFMALMATKMPFVGRG